MYACIYIYRYIGILQTPDSNHQERNGPVSPAGQGGAERATSSQGSKGSPAARRVLRNPTTG